MVTQIGQVEEYVRLVIQQTEERQKDIIKEQMKMLKKEISSEMIAAVQRQEAHLKEVVMQSGEGVERAVKESADKMSSDKIELEGRVNEALAQITTALMKLEAAEQNMLPTIELRFNKLESDIAQLEAQRR